MAPTKDLSITLWAHPEHGEHGSSSTMDQNTYSTRPHRAQATAPQPQQVRTHCPHRARSHWPQTTFPSAARTHEEQAMVVAADRSMRKKHQAVSPRGRVLEGRGCGLTSLPCSQREKALTQSCPALALDPLGTLQPSTAPRPHSTRDAR